MMRIFSLALLFMMAISAWPDDVVYMYRLSLRDKAATEYCLDRPEKFLGARSLERRARQGISVDSADIPVPSAYLERIRKTGLDIVSTSRWCNTVVVETRDSSALWPAAGSLPFVKSVRKVYEGPSSRMSDESREDRMKGMLNSPSENYGSHYGASYRQIAQLGGTALHDKGLRGDGMTVAIIDGGFLNADLMKAFERTRILGTRDFVSPSSDIYAENAHGMKVLSCIGATWDGSLVGTAPEASFYLLRSENTSSEQLVEQDYWCAAAEYADSLGVDVITTSLGYSDLDGDMDDIRHYELDGRSTLISQGASAAAERGIIVCVSAGNSGNGTWKKITPPADAFGVLAVGAVDKSGRNATFSSLGNTQDGRVKPDVMALGVESALLDDNGTVSAANGTSFAAPILAGLVTCLWQGLRNLTSEEIIRLVQSCSSNASHPDNVNGYGIPDFAKAYEEGLRMLSNR